MLTGINASYNTSECIVFTIMGEGFSTLATEPMQEFLKSLVEEPNAEGMTNHGLDSARQTSFDELIMTNALPGSEVRRTL